jgi:hypothetical protein
MIGQSGSLPRDAFVLAESAYKFGIGSIVVHSAQVLGEVEFDCQLWLSVRAYVANGDAERHGGFVDRELYVAATAWARAVDTIERSRPGADPPATP